MGSESKLITFIFIALLLIMSYGYATGEAQDAADADPTHTGKAFLADVVPYFWMFFILVDIGIIGIVTFDEII